MPNRSAVAGMSCIRPAAPRGEVAQGLNADSQRTIARTSSGFTLIAARRVVDERAVGGGRDRMGLEEAELERRQSDR